MTQDKRERERERDGEPVKTTATWMEREGEEREIEKKKERERETGLHPIIAAGDLIVISDNPIPKKLRCPPPTETLETLLTSIFWGGEISPRFLSR